MLDEARALAAVQERSYASAPPSIKGSWPKASAMDVDGMASFLDRKRYAVLATATPNGRPQAAPIAFCVGDGAFWIATVAGARLRNLRATPFGSLVIAEGERGDHRALRADGAVTLHEDEMLAAAWARLETRWLERHGSAPTSWAAAFIELRPEHVFSYEAEDA